MYMQVPVNHPSNPPSPNSTMMYDKAECGDAGGDVFISPQLQHGNPTLYGPIPIYDNPYLGQMGGGGAKTANDSNTLDTPSKVPWNLCQCIPLTPLSSKMPEDLNFAHCCAEMVASPSQPSGASSTTQPAKPLGVHDNQALVDDFFESLNDETIAGLAHDRFSSFSSLKDEHSQVASAATKKTSQSPTIVDNAKLAHSLLEDFYVARQYQELVLPPPPPHGLAASHATAIPSLVSNNAPNPFIEDPSVATIAQVKKWFFQHFKKELKRCNLKNDRECWPSFKNKYGITTEAYLQAALDLDQVAYQKETLQQWTRHFQKHCARLEKLNQEGVENRFQTFTVVVGDCLQEDQGLGNIIATPGLTDLNARLMATKITDEIDPVQLINELNETMGSLEAELKGFSCMPVEEQDEEDPALEDESNVISSCKKHLIAMLTQKRQAGYKDLGSKDGHLHLAAIQSRKLKIVKADSMKIKMDEIAVITTAEPTTSDASTVHSRAIFASGKTLIGNSAPKSTAATHVKRKKCPVIEINSGDEQEADPLVMDKSDNPSASKAIYTVSSDSESLPCHVYPNINHAAVAKKQQPRVPTEAQIKQLETHVPTVCPDSESNIPCPVKKKSWVPPPTKQ
ncbi:hypothetical protein C0992_003996 [Termitomyces sp. T32_za158]|nr:hypothetical protein C0992_003996 [Termitomyces sp. T32_za158]